MTKTSNVGDMEMELHASPHEITLIGLLRKYEEMPRTEESRKKMLETFMAVVDYFVPIKDEK